MFKCVQMRALRAEFEEKFEQQDDRIKKLEPISTELTLKTQEDSWIRRLIQKIKNFGERNK